MAPEKFEKYDLSVLYVEDDINIRELGKEIILRKVEKVLIAENGLTGYQLFLEHRPDIVVTDIKMPGMSGLELASQIKAVNKETEIIVSSAFSETEYLKKAIELGISVYVVKPFDSKKLFAAIEKCYESINLRREVRRKEKQLVQANLELEQKVIERTQALVLEHEFRDKLFEMDPSFIMITDMEGRIKFANKTIQTALCCGEDEQKNINGFKAFFKSKYDVDNKFITDLVDRKKEIESVFVTEEKTLHILWNFRYIYKDNLPFEVLCYGANITFRKEFEMLLDRRNTLLRAVAQSANYFLTIYDTSEALRLCLESIGNASGSNMVAYLASPNRTTRKSWPKDSVIFWANEKLKDQSEILSKIEKMSLQLNNARKERLLKGEHLFLDTDPNNRGLYDKVKRDSFKGNVLLIPVIMESFLSGVLCFVSSDCNRQWDEGEISIFEALASTLSNVFRRKVSEDELLKLSAAVNQSSSVVFITDRFGNIEYVNSKFSQVTLYSPEEVIGKNPRFLKSGKQSENFYQNLWDTINSGKEWHNEMYNKKKNDEYYWALASISPIKNSSGKITHFIAIQEDITQRKNISEELERAKIIAESANHAKTTFLANMSHELRTPLNGIIGMTSLLENTDLNDKQREYLKMLKASSEILLRLINDVLDLTKIESGKLELNNSLFDFKAKVLEIINSFSIRINRKKVDLSYTFDHGIPGFVVGDFLRLQQVLNNIIGNAIKFTPEGTVKVSVSGTKISNNKIELLFSVKDTGIGVSREQYDLLFRRFSQVDSSTTRKYGGSGLGLVIAKQLVEMMEGKIWFESEPGKGSIFSFTVIFDLPQESVVSQPAAPSKYHEIPKKQEEKKSSIHVLLVDDSQINRYLLINVLEQQSYKVDTACDGLEALDKIKKSNYNVVLMDIQMPVMDGFEATIKIRENEKETGKHLPIIALTAHAYEEDEKKCLESGMDGYVSKPIDYGKLFSLIEKFALKTDPVDYKVEIDDLLKAINKNQEIFDKLVKYYTDNYPALLNALIESVKNNDYISTAKNAHTLKAATGNFGAKHAAELISKIEEMGIKKNLDGCNEALYDVTIELKKVEDFLTSYKIKTE